MTIASEIQRIKDNIATAYAECSAKGASLPLTENSANLPDTISRIPGGGGGGDDIIAVNKTGAVINKGDKLWINDSQQTAGTSYIIENYASSSVSSSSGVLSRDGTFAWRRGGLWAIGSDSATSLGSFSGSASTIKYVAQNSVFLGTSRIDNGAQYTTSYTSLLGDDFVFAGTAGDSKIYQINMADGSVLNTWTSSDSNTFLSTEGVKVGNYFYRLNSSARYKCHLGTDGTIVYDGNFTYQNPYVYSLYPLGVTSDKKYIICSTSIDYSNSTSQNTLQILEVVDDNTIKRLTVAEAPADLQPFMTTEGATWGHKLTFNPYTGIVTAVTYNSTSFVVVKYQNGTWTKLPIDLGLGEEPLKGSLTLSDDLTRACIAYGNTGSWYAYIIILEESEYGYFAVSYAPYNITSDTITGYAKSQAEIDDTFAANIAEKVK